MTLERKFVITVGTALLAILALAYFALRFFTLRSFSAIEAQHSMESLHRTVRVIQHDLGSLQTAANDWAAWDATYEYAARSNAAFIAENMMDSTFQNLHVNLLLIVNSNRQVVYAKEYDLEKRQEAGPARGLCEHLANIDHFAGDTNYAATAAGVVSWRGAIYLVACQPILTSLNAGPARGRLFMARMLGEFERRSLEYRLGYFISLLPGATATMPRPGIDAAKWCDIPAHRHHMIREEYSIATDTLLLDLQGEPSVVLKVAQPRLVMLQARLNVNYLLITLLTAGIFLVLTAVIVIRNLALTGIQLSITKLRQGIAKITSQGDPAYRVKFLARDEIGLLTEAINDMLAALETTNRKLAESETQYRTLVESATDAIFTMDRSGTFGRINPAARTLFSSVSTPPPRTIQEVFTADDGERQPARALEQVWTTGKPVFAFEAALPANAGGKRLTISLTPIFLKPGGQVDAVLGIAHDISRRVAAEAQARRQQQHLVQAHKLVALGTLVAGVAHEINNPNNIIVLNIGIVKRVATSLIATIDQCPGAGQIRHGSMTYEEIKRILPALLDDIESGSTRIQAIVNDLKDFARKEPGLSHVPTCLPEVIDAAVKLIAHQITKSTRHFTLKKTAGIPPVMANAQRIEQVFINLLQNACQSLPDDSRAIAVELTWDQESRKAEIVISDEGIGIDQHQLSQLGDPFFTTKRGEGGMGLGLFVSFEIIKEHDGTMEFNSTPGRGTRVTIRLPTCEEEATTGV